MKVIDIVKLAKSYITQGELGRLSAETALDRFLKLKKLGAKDDDDVDEFIDSHSKEYQQLILDDFKDI